MQERARPVSRVRVVVQRGGAERRVPVFDGELTPHEVDEERPVGSRARKDVDVVECVVEKVLGTDRDEFVKEVGVLLLEEEERRESDDAGDLLERKGVEEEVDVTDFLQQKHELGRHVCLGFQQKNDRLDAPDRLEEAVIVHPGKEAVKVREE